MRQIAKTTTYGTMHLTVAILVAYALSHNWALALSIGVIEPLIQTVAYTFHEMAWGKNQKSGDAHGM